MAFDRTFRARARRSPIGRFLMEIGETHPFSLPYHPRFDQTRDEFLRPETGVRPQFPRSRWNREMTKLRAFLPT